MAERASMPETIGRYAVVLPIASGGMATVYLARQQGLAGFERDVAVKLMHGHLREDEHWTLEFLEEAKLAARIRHPNVVQVIDVGEDPSGTFLVMDYVEGETLSGLLKLARKENRPLPRPIALKILHDVLSGLHAAHELKDESGAQLDVVHRDFSPQNVLVGTDGVARLTDFGIAKAASRLTFTHTGTVKGKVAYMSPEQARGHKVDRRCDVWAAGVVAWEMLANQRLFPASEDIAVGIKILTEKPQPLREVDPTIPASVSDAVASALESDLARRCPTAAELARRLVEGQEVADTATVARYVLEAASQKLEDRRTRASDAAAQSASGLRTRSASASVSKAALPRAQESLDITHEPPRASALRRIGVPLLVLAVAAGAVGFVVARNGHHETASTAPSAAASGRDVVFRSDVPLAACRVGARAIVPDAPASTLTIHLDPAEAESHSALDVQAIAADGRRANETLSPGATSVQFHFGEKSVASASAEAIPSAPAPVATVAKQKKPAAVHLTPKSSSAPQKPSLADDPYGGKP